MGTNMQQKTYTDQLAESLGISSQLYDRNAIRDTFSEIESRNTANCKETFHLDVLAQKPALNGPLHDIALSILIRTARDLAHSMKRVRDGLSQALSTDARDAIQWLENPFQEGFNLEFCCYILFTSDVCPVTVGRAILANPSSVAVMDMPPPPSEYISLIEQQENMIKQNRKNRKDEKAHTPPFLEGLRVT